MNKIIKGENGELWTRVNGKPEWAISNHGRVIRTEPGSNGRFKAGHPIKFRPINRIDKGKGYLGTVSEGKMMILHKLGACFFFIECFLVLWGDLADIAGFVSLGCEDLLPDD